MSAYVWEEKVSRKTRSYQRKEEREAQVKDEDNFMESLGRGIEPPPFTPVFSQTEWKLDLREDCAGIVIGKKGENIRSVEQRFKVTIRIEDLNAPARPAGVFAPRAPRGAARGPQQVIISGLSPAAVAAAAQELDVVAETLEVAPEMAGWAVGKGGKHLRLIKELSGIGVLSVKRTGGDKGAELEEGEVAEAIRLALEAEQESGGRKRRGRKSQGETEAEGEVAGDAGAEDGEDHEEGEGADAAPAEAAATTAEPAEPEQCWFEMKGQRHKIAHAMMLFEAHLGYWPVYEEMREVEAELDQEIAEAHMLLGRFGGGRGRGGGGCGGRGRGGPAGAAAESSGAGTGPGAVGGQASQGGPPGPSPSP